MTANLYSKTLSFFTLIVISSFSAEAAEIRIKGSVRSHGSLVLLGDVAEIHDSDPDVVRALERVELFPAPVASRARTLRLRELRELLRLNGVDLAACRFSGAEVTRIIADPEARPLEIFATEPVVPRPPAETVVVAVRPLERGEVIREADVTLQSASGSTRSIAALRGRSLIHEISDAIGLEVTRPLAADQPLDARMLRRPLLVRRGELIQVTARAAGVSVRTFARALEEGALGDLIRLQSTENREQYSARVTAFQQAEILASGVRVSSLPPATEPAKQQRDQP